MSTAPCKTWLPDSRRGCFDRKDQYEQPSDTNNALTIPDSGIYQRWPAPGLGLWIWRSVNTEFLRIRKPGTLPARANSQPEQSQKKCENQPLDCFHGRHLSTLHSGKGFRYAELPGGCRRALSAEENEEWKRSETGISGAPWKIRTSDLLVRSQTLYPAELRARCRIDEKISESDYNGIRLLGKKAGLHRRQTSARYTW
jgi:hypothetical protein